MKIVIVSDLHGDKETLGVPRTGEVASAVQQSVELAQDVKADLFLCLGDVADPDNGGGTFAAIDIVMRAALTLEHASIPSVWIAGNHDVLEDGSGLTVLSPLARFAQDGTRMVYVAERPKVIHFTDGETDEREPNVALICLPFTPVSHAYDPREAANRLIKECEGEKLIIAAHLNIEGVIPGEETTEMPRGREVMFPTEETRGAVLRLNGHYHRRQTTREGIIIPGSLVRLTFGEEKHEPGIMVIEV